MFDILLFSLENKVCVRVFPEENESLVIFFKREPFLKEVSAVITKEFLVSADKTFVECFFKEQIKPLG